MSIMLKALLKTLSSKLLTEVILLALDYVAKKDLVDKDIALCNIATKAGCTVKFKKA